MGGGDKGYLGLPAIDRERFNRLSKLYYPNDAVCWVKDKQNIGVIDPDEINRCEWGDAANFTKPDPKGRPEFNSLFDSRYQQIVELARQEAVRKQLARNVMFTIPVDLNHYKLNAAQKDLVSQILKVGTVVDELFQMQLGSHPFREQLEQGGTPADQELFSRYQEPWCQSNDDPLCNGLPTFTPYVSPIYPNGMTSEELKGDLSTPFSVVTRSEQGQYEAVPYAQSFLSPKMQEAAEEMMKAADLAVAAGEKGMADYLRKLAAAMASDKPYPYGEVDAAWNAMKGKSKFYLRVGPDETGWDKFETKAGFHMTFGIIDPNAEKKISFYSKLRQKMEDAFASVIGSPYKARKVEVSMPDFVDVVMESGEDHGRVDGTNAAQTLPNWCGEDGTADCTRRTMLFSNKTSRGYGPAIMQHYAKLLAPESFKYFNPNATATSAVNHEFAHNLGPQMGDRFADGITMKDALGDMGLKMEEMKAELGGTYLEGWLAAGGHRTKEQVRQSYTAALLWSLTMLRRGLPQYKNGKFHEVKSPYILLSAVRVGYLMEKGALSFDPSAGEFGQFTIDYDKVHAAATDLLHDVGQLYANHDREGILAFYQKYTKERIDLLHLDAIDKAVGDVPVGLFRYDVSGFEEK
ncbi:MAG: hypothetical protein Q7S68_05680 [Deltaproteobacteria bacterium]|nr:hypothetical protein [Deltaproteobacteria bacterium]